MGRQRPEDKKITRLIPPVKDDTYEKFIELEPEKEKKDLDADFESTLKKIRGCEGRL